MTSKEQFIRDLYPAARQVSLETGMSSDLILAQAAQETGWGQKVLPGTNNIFNIKADGAWHGASKVFSVPEFESGKMVWREQSFRVYGSQEEALRDRVAFLRANPRYADAGLFKDGTKGDLRKEAEALQRAGYATDPHYAESLVRVFNGPTMQRAIKDARFHGEVTAPAVLRLGDRGESVGALQFDLRALGYADSRGVPVDVDNNFGSRTANAVQAFQRDQGLKVDGIVGPETTKALHAQRQALNRVTPPFAPELAGWNKARALEPPAKSGLLPNPFADPEHPDHGLYAELKSRIPDASENRLVQLAAACHMAGIRSGYLGDVHIGQAGAVLRSEGFLLQTVVDISTPAPPLRLTVQQMEAFDLHQAQEKCCPRVVPVQPDAATDSPLQTGPNAP